MTTVYKAMSLRVDKCKGDVGIEIEVEGTNLPILRKHWRNEVDGSLRGMESREYVFDKPKTMKEAREALDYLNTCYVNNNTVVDETVRAGVHVHVNCQELTLIELYNFIVLYLILENPLVKFCGEYREGNLFCLRACDAEYLIQQLIFAAKNKSFRRTFHTDQLRYASMNVKALGDYGSLEFRSMRGTRDLDLIYNWADTLVNLREVAKNYESPVHIMVEYSQLGPVAFAKKALGLHFDMYQCNDLEKIVGEGMRMAQDVAFCVDWNTWKIQARIIGGLEFFEGDDINEPQADF